MMNGSDAAVSTPRPELAALTNDVRVRVLNVSAAGCLVEADRPIEIGSVATLRITFSGGDFEDTVQVVRCQEITGAGAVYHVATSFLAASPPSTESLRYLLRSHAWRSPGGFG